MAIYSLLDTVNGESTADGFEIDTYTAKHDIVNHLKVTICEDINPFNSLDELAAKTDAHHALEYGLAQRSPG